MKKTLVRHKTNIPKIPFSKTSTHKISLNLSIPATKKCFSKNKNDSIFKDTVDGSNMDTQILAFNQDSLNNSKLTMSKNQSLGKLDNKLLLFTSSLKYSLNKRNKSSNYSKNIPNKTNEECSENISSSEDEVKSNNLYNEADEDTNKIDYRYYPKIPEIEANKDDNNSYYWLATYDKLMKKSKIVKILNYYSDSLSHRDTEIFVIEDANSDYNEEETKERIKKMNEKYNFKEKTMIIQGYEIYFVKKHGKPFIRQKKGGKLFIKLYLLTLEQINQIYSYINRLEYKQYINNLNSFKERNSFKIINNFNKSIYNYSTLFCLGTFMNISIYSFSHIIKNKDYIDNNNQNYNVNDLPSTNKIAKIIKALMMNFPDFSKQYFIDYLMKPKGKNCHLDSHDNEILQQKMAEVNSLIMTNNKKELNLNVNNANNIIKNTIKCIPTYTPSSINSHDINTINKSNNTSFLNILDKNTINNYNTNTNTNNKNDNNCSDFLSNIKNELEGLTNLSKTSKISDYEYKEELARQLKQIKLNNTGYTRNIHNSILNSHTIQNAYNLKGNINQNICKTISMINPNQKSLTRNNSNSNFTHYKKTKNIKSNNNSIKKIKQKSSFFSKKNKENDSSFLNKNFSNEYYTENKNILNKNNSKKKLLMKSDKRKSFKITRNKNNLYSPFYTTNNTNLNSINRDTQDNKDSKSKKPLGVISSIRKVISQKMNNLSDNSNSFIKFKKSESNSSLKETNNRYFNNSNLFINTSKYNRISCKTNNNSLVKNNKSEYITPLKKKFYYYYH